MRWIDRFRRKVVAYQRLFGPAADGMHTDAAIVMADLREFCCHNRSTLKVSPVTRTVDPLATAMAEGRREVFLLIASHLDFTERQLAKLINEKGDDSI